MFIYYKILKSVDIIFLIRFVYKYKNVLLRSLSGKYPWERNEPPNPLSYRLNSTTGVLLGEWLRH